MAREQKNHFPVKLRYIVLFVILMALLLAAVGTLAWMRHMRSLQTATLVQVTTLTLVGPTPNSAIVNLGDIDVSEPGPKSYVFGVETSSGNNSNFQVQLAHTTNTPFRYTIYSAEKLGSPQDGAVKEQGVYFKKGDAVRGGYKNETSPGSKLASQESNNSYYTGTYGSYLTNVQQNAAPLYWQSDIITPTPTPTATVTYFILDVSWDAGENNKETDMVYLTVGTPIDNQGGSQ